ncbi:MAG: CC/Se motif family (seleno)protein [Pseudomonadota bacterium]|uniref:CC/Se motif family (seleno)protein n=1 Tax=Halomonas alkaliantarctica TaxID=232346 RepID=UPI0004AB42E8|nr:CC/Se motif family (seleno)protein [Halomonas alkaliantarctica]
MKHVIEIDSDAIDFIKQQGSAVTVRLSPRHGCCGGLANLAVAEAQSPNATQHYQHHVQENISIYIAPELAHQGLRIGVEGWWKFRHLYVDGTVIQSK